MDDSEFDIYDDLDDFENKEKQAEKSADFLELQKKFQEAEEEIRRLQAENESLKEQIGKHKKIESRLERNGSSLLITAKAEIKRKDDEIHELRKEKDNIVFRRKHRLQSNVQTRNSSTQSQISCKPFTVYELKEIDDDTIEKSTERSHRRDENPRSNPFASKSNNCIGNKANQKTRDTNQIDKNSNQRQQSRNPDDLRGKLSNQRSRNDDRRDQSNAERPKRRRSRSASKDRKRARRSRSRSRERRRDRRNERISPDKGNRNQQSRTKSESKEEPKCQKSKRSTTSHDSDEKWHSKQKLVDNTSTRNSSKRKSDDENQPKENEYSTKHVTSDENMKNSTKTEVDMEKPIYCNQTDDALEEGEIDEDSKSSPTEDFAEEQKLILQLKPENDTNNKSDVMVIKTQHESEKVVENNNKTSLNSKDEMNLKPKIASGKSDEPINSPLDEIDAKPAIITAVEPENTVATEIKTEDIEPIQKTEDVEMTAIDNTELKPIENIVMHEKDSIIEMPKNAEKNDENSVPNLQNIQVENIKTANLQDVKSENDQNISKPDEVHPINDENPPILISPTANNNTKLNEHDNTKQSKHTKQTESNLNGHSFTDIQELLNTSGNKSVKNISTSSKDYVIVENENNETDIYVTRKKKKKKKKSLATA